MSTHVALGTNIGSVKEAALALSSYYYFDDGEAYMRKGVRFDDPDQNFVVDIRLTDSPGFNGVEDTDFEVIYGIEL